MKEYAFDELIERGFFPIRLEDNSYLGKDYGDGRQIIFKQIPESNFFYPHGARDSDLKMYDESQISELADEIGTLEELESALHHHKLLTK